MLKIENIRLGPLNFGNHEFMRSNNIATAFHLGKLSTLSSSKSGHQTALHSFSPIMGSLAASFNLLQVYMYVYMCCA